MSVDISAVVCTYNRKDTLLEAVASLVAQDLPAPRYEILVVDNRSTDGSLEAVAAAFPGVANLRVIREERQGIAFARNTGARACRSPVAAFLDDDALAPPDWLRCFLDLFETLDPVPAIIGGDMTPLFGGERPPWLTDALLRALSVALRWSTYARPLKPHPEEWLCELNSAYRVEPLLRFGGFPEHVGRVGDNLLSNENCVNRVLQEAGYVVYYDPKILVRHRVPTNRLEQSWFRRRAFWGGVSEAAQRSYLLERGIEDRIPRPLALPCAPADWARVFDDSATESLSGSLGTLNYLGYLLGAQGIIGNPETADKER